MVFKVSYEDNGFVVLFFGGLSFQESRVSISVNLACLSV